MSALETRANIVAVMVEQHVADRRLQEALGWTEEYYAAVLGGRGPLTGSQIAAIAAALNVDPRELTSRVRYRCPECDVELPGVHRFNCPTLGPDLLLLDLDELAAAAL